MATSPSALMAASQPARVCCQIFKRTLQPGILEGKGEKAAKRIVRTGKPGLPIREKRPWRLANLFAARLECLKNWFVRLLL